jgi:lactate dehydrogenase-like 2-hydroxyacid dehydrogenase
LSQRPLVILSHFTHQELDLEREIAGERAELYVQPVATALENPVPPEVRRSADAILHFAANRAVDGAPEDYPKVRAVLRSGVGFDNIDVRGWGARGVPVFNVPDYGTSEVADHAIALMLALVRGTATYHEKLRADPVGSWHHAVAPKVMRLRGKIFGVVGLGRIGLAAATRARAFGMTIAFHDPFQPSGYEIAVEAVRCATLEELMAVSDVVSVHAPASEETRGLVGRAALAAAKPGIVLINTARGAVVDLDALHDAMREERVAAAGLDVLPREPADPEHPLIAAWTRREPWLDGRLTLSPHAAFYSPTSIRDMRVKGMETILRTLATGDLMNCVNGDFLKR